MNIVIPHKDRGDYLALTLDSIPQGHNVWIIRGGTFAENINKGFSLNPTDEGFTIFCNDDVILSQQTLGEIGEAMLYADICGVPQFIPSANMNMAGQGYNENKKGRYDFNVSPFKNTDIRTKVIIPSGALFAVRNRLFERLGGFDEAYKNGKEDIAFFLKAKEDGAIFALTQTSITHFCSKSSGRFDNVIKNDNIILKEFPEERVKAIINSKKNTVHICITGDIGEQRVITTNTYLNGTYFNITVSGGDYYTEFLNSEYIIKVDASIIPDPNQVGRLVRDAIEHPFQDSWTANYLGKITMERRK